MAAIKEDAPEWVALFTYASGAARVTSRTEFHRHLRVLRGFPSVSSPDRRPALHSCVDLHARTYARTAEYVLRNVELATTRNVKVLRVKGERARHTESRTRVY